MEVDTLHVPASSGDRLLFCSDGLWEVVRDPALEEVLRRHADASQATTQLITLAKERDGRDDMTAIVVDLTQDGAPAKRPGISHIRSNRADLAV